MVVAGHGRGASERDVPEEDGAILAIATAYVDQAKGDLRQALLAAVRDGVATAECVSVGFMRWGQPAKRAIP